MFKVMLVDDEKWIRKGLRAVIDGKRLNIDEIIEAENAEEAEKAFHDPRKPDILICDVRMPVKDGCTFCEEVMQKHPKTKIIMVTGYDEFSYVQRALKYRAADYLLKPVDKEELNNAIGKCEEDLCRERESKRIATSDAMTLERLIGQGIQHPSSLMSKQLEEYTKRTIGDFENYFVFILEYNAEIYEAANLKREIGRVVQGYSDDELHLLEFGEGENSMDFILFRKSSYLDKGSLIKRIVLGLQSRETHQICISSSDLYKEIASVPLAYREAMNYLGYRKADGSFQYNTADGMSRNLTTDGLRRNLTANGLYSNLSESYLSLAKELVDAMKQQNGNRLEELFMAIRDLLQSEKELPLKTIKVYLNSILYDCIRVQMKDHSLEGQLMEEGLQKSDAIMRSFNVDQATRAVFEFVRKSAQAYDKRSQKEVRKIVEEVIEYLKINYQEDIGLNDIEAKFYVNASYFSYMFREVTGETFVNFLTNLRMNEAKKLLRISNLKINEIASRVGVADSRYFCKVFKKVTGMAPIDYRMGNLNND